MKISIHQPNYIPWLGFWDKLLKSDMMVLLDTVQFTKNEFQNRQKIKLSQGGVHWLTIPVHGSTKLAINEVKIDNTITWAKKHLHTLRFNYERAGFWKELGPSLTHLYMNHGQGCEYLQSFNIDLIAWVIQELSINRYTTLSSTLLGEKQDLGEDPTSRIIRICKSVDADCYLSGAGAGGYLDVNQFKEAGIALEFQHFEHPVYPQRNGSFVPNLSVLDLILNVGCEKALDVLLGKKIE